jgi:hypothetical protein
MSSSLIWYKGNIHIWQSSWFLMCASVTFESLKELNVERKINKRYLYSKLNLKLYVH